MLSINDSLTSLKIQFHHSLPERLKALHAQYCLLDLNHWCTEDAGGLYSQLHNLTGNAGTFGMQSLSAAARQLELRLKTVLDVGSAPTEEAWSAIGSELACLERLALNQLHSSPEYLAQQESFPRLNWAPLVHLVEDDPYQAKHLEQALDDAGYRIHVFTTLDDFLAAFGEGDAPDAIVLNMNFPEGHEADARVLSQLKAMQMQCPPVVFVSVRDDIDARLAAFKAGASRYMLKPVNPDALAGALDSLTGRVPRKPYRVLLVDDDPLQVEAQSAVLMAAGMAVQTRLNPRDTLEALDEFKPDVLILDVYMPDILGPELAAIVRERNDYLSLPILFISAESDKDEQLRALNLGGDDFLVKPVDSDHLVSAVTARARRSRQKSAIERRLQITLYEREQEHVALDFHALVSVTDARGNITEVNNQFCQVSGYSQDELLGQNHRIIKSAEHSPEFYHDIWRTIVRGDVWQGEICNQRKDGSLYWVSSTITPFLDADGHPYQFVSIRTDITQLKTAEATQRAQNAMREVLGEAAAKLLTANAETLDIAIEQVLFRVGAHLEADRAYLVQLSNDGMDINHSHEWRASDIPSQRDARPAITQETTPWFWAKILQGQPIIVSRVSDLPAKASLEKAMLESLGLRSIYIFSIQRGGSLLGFIGFDQVNVRRGFSPAVTDLLSLLSGFIGSALLRSQSEEKIRQQQRFTQDVLDSIQAHIAVLDQNGVIVAVNEPWRRFGLANGRQKDMEGPSKDIGINYISMCRSSIDVKGESTVDIASGIKSVLTGKTPGFRHEYSCNSSADAFWFSMRVMPLKGSGGGVVVSHIDITQRKQSEFELIASREDADRANHAKSEFLSSMSHELRTPMNAILGFGQLMENDADLPEEHQDYVQEILKAGQHLLTLINEVLDLSRIESGDLELELEPVALKPVIDECLSLVNTLAQRRHLQLTVRNIQGLVLRADSTRLKQALLNLLSNAIKYNREGGNVTVDTYPVAGNRLRLEVTDTGQGIAEARQAELFQPFNRLDAEQSEIEGTGIGLTITRRLVELMDGAVGMHSELDKGSTFWIELPQEATTDKNEGEARGAATGSIDTVSAVQGEMRTVLYIEDNPANLKLVTQILGRVPRIHLLTAHTSSLGIELALARQLDLILLDINLPGMDGYQVLKILKADARLQQTPVIAITANAMPRDVERGKAAGFVDYLTKPLDVERFIETVQRCLAGDIP